MIQVLAPLLLASLAAAPLAPRSEDPTPANGEAERDAITRAVLDYAESYYEARPDYVERGLSKDLVKLGLERRPDGGYDEHAMDYAAFERMVAWVVEHGKPAPGPKDIVILEALDKTALVKLTGSWGTDYMQLTKEADRWQTRQVVWQTAPVERTAAEVLTDEQGVERAVRDYVEALYLVKPELIERSVRKDLAKYGFWLDPETRAYRAMAMSFDALHSLSARWNASGWLPADAPYEIEVLDTMDTVACAKLTADWGVDAMHLVKRDGKWQIQQVLWQSLPEVGEG